MQKPKLIHYNDARHYSIYRYEPPMSLHQWRQPVDEILGTDVDTLVYGLGSGETFLHGTQAGLKWGEGVEEHNMSMMWWRATKNLDLALEAGIDPLAVAVERAHEKGRHILGSLRMTEPTSPDDANPYMLGRLKREHPEVMIGENHPDYPRAAGCADYTREEVRAERLEVIEEVCGRYGMDGLEFDPYMGVFFKPSEAREKTPVLTEFVREIRQLLDRLGDARGESLCLAARVRATEEANLALGMDVRTWLEEGLLDLVFPWTESFLFDQEMPIGWVVEAAAALKTPIYPMLGRSPYDDRHHLPTIEMYRAAAANYRTMGADGLYLSDLPWPHTEREYQVFREMADPDIHLRKKKHYFPAQREPNGEPHAPERCLPVDLEEGVPARVPFLVGDRLDDARNDGELKIVSLGVRIGHCCPEDDISFRFNGETVKPSESTHHYGGIVSYTAARSGLPERILTHFWFTFDLPHERVREGKNEVEVVLEKRFTGMGGVRVLHQVELFVAYDEPLVPVGGQM